MITTRKKEISQILEELNAIEDKKARIDEIRRICGDVPAIARVIQYTYHPDVVFDLPPGEVPESLITNRQVYDYSILYQAVKKLPVMFKSSPANRVAKERQFIDLITSISSGDAALVVGMKNKRLPQRKLTENFCKEALPELFPFQPASENQDVSE